MNTYADESDEFNGIPLGQTSNPNPPRDIAAEVVLAVDAKLETITPDEILDDLPEAMFDKNEDLLKLAYAWRRNDATTVGVLIMQMHRQYIQRIAKKRLEGGMTLREVWEA